MTTEATAKAEQAPIPLVPLMVPNTDVIILVQQKHIVRIGGTKEKPLFFVKGIQRAFTSVQRS